MISIITTMNSLLAKLLHNGFIFATFLSPRQPTFGSPVRIPSGPRHVADRSGSLAFQVEVFSRSSSTSSTHSSSSSIAVGIHFAGQQLSCSLYVERNLITWFAEKLSDFPT
ncbi:hypothetical protein PCASD_15425 [Puccinia coronata f. sp. avenae]|uniref:Uncharacterized protein n=1 Tax=Puccinia coronata f. sp. avenae TaxID=200324 RepID=A0A2N5U234_9BASI|nr:hypothetical protein PCASD_15425 [Puccinia coronata f. sp. avenae]